MNQQIVQQIRRLAAAFPQPPVTAETTAVYVDALSDMDPEALRLAVDVVIRSDDWFPKIKRLRTACEEFAYGQLSAADDKRWLERYINGIGAPYDPVSGVVSKPKSWPNPVMEEAVRLFGWQRFQESNPEYLARDWEKVWNEARGLVLKRAAIEGPVGDALPQPETVRPALKAVG